MARSFLTGLIGLSGAAEDTLRIATIGIMVALTFIQVVLRILFSWGSPVWEEAARFVMIWSIAAGMIVTTRNDEHIKIDIIASMRLSKKVRIVGDIVGKLTCFIILCIFTWWSWDFILWSIGLNQRSYLLGMPMYPVHAAFLIGGVVSSLHMLAHLINRVKEGVLFIRAHNGGAE